MSREEVINNFRGLAGKGFVGVRLDEIFRSIGAVEGMDKVPQIARLMATPSWTRIVICYGEAFAVHKFFTVDNIPY